MRITPVKHEPVLCHARQDCRRILGPDTRVDQVVVRANVGRRLASRPGIDPDDFASLGFLRPRKVKSNVGGPGRGGGLGGVVQSLCEEIDVLEEEEEAEPPDESSGDSASDAPGDSDGDVVEELVSHVVVPSSAGASVTQWERIAASVGMVERDNVLYVLATGEEVGHMEILHGASMSFKAVCHRHNSGAPSSSGAKSKQKHSCYCLISAMTNVWEKYEQLLLWLKKGVAVSEEEHRDASAALRESVRKTPSSSAAPA